MMGSITQPTAFQLKAFCSLDTKKMKLHHVQKPSDLCSVNISHQNFALAKESDFMQFDSVAYINATENLLTLETFRNFPGLRELELSLNGLRNLKVRTGDFPHLEDVRTLGMLPRLKALHLTANGLSSLPLSLASPDSRNCPRFPALEVLLLDDNQLSDSSVFLSLANLRRLKQLNLDKNGIKEVPYLHYLGHDHFSIHPLSAKSGIREGLRCRKKSPQKSHQDRSLRLNQQYSYIITQNTQDPEKTGKASFTAGGFQGPLSQRHHRVRKQRLPVDLALETTFWQLWTGADLDPDQRLGSPAVEGSQSFSLAYDPNQPILSPLRPEERSADLSQSSLYGGIFSPGSSLEGTSFGSDLVLETSLERILAGKASPSPTWLGRSPLEVLPSQLASRGPPGLPLPSSGPLPSKPEGTESRPYLRTPSGEQEDLGEPSSPAQSLSADKDLPSRGSSAEDQDRQESVPTSYPSVEDLAEGQLDQQRIPMVVLTTISSGVEYGDQEEPSQLPTSGFQDVNLLESSEEEEHPESPSSPLVEYSQEERPTLVEESLKSRTSRLSSGKVTLNVPEKFRGYEELLGGDPGSDFVEPKGIQQNVQALEKALRYPLVYREGKARLDCYQKPYVSTKKK
ncbi:X-ray radiation resistance-associated protein 1, partial [Ophiophagus hannah]